MANNTSPHIVNTSANLLGFCLFVITSLHFTNTSEIRLIDKLTSVIAVLLTCSCVFSFISIKTENSKREKWTEAVANYLFLGSLAGILFIILLITSNYIKFK